MRRLAQVLLMSWTYFFYLGAAHIGIALTFTAKRTFRAVSRDKNRVVAHWPQAFRDAADEGVVVPLWKISAPDKPRIKSTSVSSSLRGNGKEAVHDIIIRPLSLCA